MKHIYVLIKILLLPFFLLINLYSLAYAYIDPGTGSFIIQTIMAIGATIVIYLGYPFRLIKNLYFKIFRSQKKNNEDLKKNDD